jgi:hypothetical protein
LIEEPEKKRSLVDESSDGRMILKWFLKIGRENVNCVYLAKESSGGLL